MAAWLNNVASLPPEEGAGEDVVHEGHDVDHLGHLLPAQVAQAAKARHNGCPAMVKGGEDESQSSVVRSSDKLQPVKI